MTIEVDHGAFDRTTALVHDIADGLRREHQRVAAEVEGLLGGSWAGMAADQFGAGWSEWCRGMTDILEAIRLQNALVENARKQFDVADQESGSAHDLLMARLGERS